MLSRRALRTRAEPLRAIARCQKAGDLPVRQGSDAVAPSRSRAARGERRMRLGVRTARASSLVVRVAERGVNREIVIALTFLIQSLCQCLHVNEMEA
jgi:hypothetical protein